MKQVDGSRTTDSIGGKPCSTGLSPIPGYTMRPLRVAHEPYRGVIFACKTASHTGQQCPQNPDRSWYGWLPSLPSLPPWPGSVPPLPSGDLPREICRRYNENKCRQGPRCRYSHQCKECRMLGIKADHPSVFCPRNQVQPQQRSRSPLRRPNPGFSQARWPAAQRP